MKTIDLTESPAFKSLVDEALQRDMDQAAQRRREAADDLAAAEAENARQAAELSREIIQAADVVAAAHEKLNDARRRLRSLQAQRAKLFFGSMTRQSVTAGTMRRDAPAELVAFLGELRDMDQAAHESFSTWQEKTRFLDRLTGKPKYHTASNAGAITRRCDAVQRVRREVETCIESEIVEDAAERIAAWRKQIPSL